MSLKTWWKSLFKKPEEPSSGYRADPAEYPWRTPDPLPSSRVYRDEEVMDEYDRRIARPNRPQEQRFDRPVRGTAPRVGSGYLDRQGYAQPSRRSRDGFAEDAAWLGADQARLDADFAEAEAALLRDEVDAADRARDRAEDAADAARDDYLAHHGHHHDHVQEDREADQLNVQDDRPILPNGAVDPTYTAYPPQDDQVGRFYAGSDTSIPAQTDEQFYGRDSDFYGTSSTPDPTPAPSYEQPAPYSAPDPAPSYDPGPSSSDTPSYDPGPSNDY